MPLSPHQFALNPIQWLATEDGWINPRLAPPLQDRLPVIAASGFSHIKTEVPAGVSVEAYRAELSPAGIGPGPGYVPMPWVTGESERRPFFERARLTAANNTALGVPLVFLALGMDQAAPRVRHPGVGYDSREDRLEQVTEYIAQAAELMASEGATPALHPHVGTWIETVDEARYVLDRVDEGILKFGPDAGHLAWTGANPAEVIAEYSSRVAGIHIKDYHSNIARRSRADDIDYRSTVLLGVWTEPGAGDANIEEVLAAVGPEFTGWVVIEVDRGSVPPAESIRRCGAWLTSRFALQNAGR